MPSLVQFGGAWSLRPQWKQAEYCAWSTLAASSFPALGAALVGRLLIADRVDVFRLACKTDWNGLSGGR
jgi:hypothetical protein